MVIFAAAALHLRPREQWIGWSDEQRRRRLALAANNVRFLLLPGRTVTNLGSAVLSRGLARLSNDWQARYDHPVLAVAIFVDPERCQAPCIGRRAGAKWGRPTATAASRATSTKIMTGPSGSSCVN